MPGQESRWKKRRGQVFLTTPVSLNCPNRAWRVSAIQSSGSEFWVAKRRKNGVQNATVCPKGKHDSVVTKQEEHKQRRSISSSCTVTFQGTEDQNKTGNLRLFLVVPIFCFSRFRWRSIQTAWKCNSIHEKRCVGAGTKAISGIVAQVANKLQSGKGLHRVGESRDSVKTDCFSMGNALNKVLNLWSLQVFERICWGQGQRLIWRPDKTESIRHQWVPLSGGSSFWVRFPLTQTERLQIMWETIHTPVDCLHTRLSFRGRI